jgi:hypothetical protein
MLAAAARAGNLWHSAGVPAYASPMKTGDLIVDTTNHDLYTVDAGAVDKYTDS